MSRTERWSRAPFSRRITAVGVAIVLSASVLAATPALADPVRAPAVPPTKVVETSEHRLERVAAPSMPQSAPSTATTWPSAGEAEVAVAAATPPVTSRDADARLAAGGTRAGGLPVQVAARGKRDATKVRVRVADQAAAQRAGVTGVLLSVTPDRSGDGPLTVGVDYSTFRDAVGAGFGSRLRLVELPACALTTPERDECRVRTPLPSTNDGAKQVVTADVTSAASVLAAVADSGGAGGQFAASSLAPSGSWSVTGNTGAFTWSYPIELPPASAGSAIEPKVTLGYNSAAVDGRTAATNNQSSWIGQGWDYEPGFIERTYRACADDKDLPAASQTGDLCWAGPVLTMSLGGQTAALVWDEGKKTWRSANDNGARVEKLSNAVNGARDGEHWKVTTTDGVQYFFGLNRLPGHTNQEQTNSAWTAPVYGPRAGDPCHNPAGFAQSSCTQAWRWNLDYVEDPHGNATAYYYSPETNHYGANKGTTGVAYTRGGTLKRIDYGLRRTNNSVYGAVVPGQVVFGVAERCTPSGAITCDPAQFTAANASHWPDTPQDQQCLAGKPCDNHAPTFWSTKRLTNITTQYNTGAGPVKVDTYDLAQQFPTAADKELWLDSITRTGHQGTTSIAVPPIKFTGQVYANRVSGYNNQPAMAHWRLTNITTDTGSVISVTYSTPDCAVGSMPNDNDLADNGKRCYPVWWTLPLNRDPILDYFHKYVITRVEVQDANALAPKQVTDYNYVGAPAWHYDDNEVVKPKYRTYGQFRGYAEVETRTGDTAHTIDGVPDARTLVHTKYFRGMDGDTLPNGGRRSVSVSSSLGDSVVDDNVFAGSVRETQMFNGDGGPRVSAAINDPVKVATTATRNRTGLPPLTANVVKTGRERKITDLAAGGTRMTSTTNRYDDLGRLVAKTDSGDGVADVCVHTQYADNTTSWVRDRAKQVTTSTEACPTGDPTATKIVAAVRTYYDGSADLGVVTGPGNATRIDTATANQSGTLVFETTGKSTFDASGRSLTTTNARGYSSTVAYTPPDGGVLAKVVTTNAKAHKETVEVEPARGNTTTMIDVAGRRTDADYDALGRLVAAWKPGRIKGSTPASSLHEYVLRADGPLAITSKALVDYGTGTNYVTSVELRDSFGQLRQTQTDATDGGRLVKDVFYDSLGRERVTNNRYLTTGTPSTSLVSVAASAVDDRTVTTYDGVGRPVLSEAYKGLTKTWATRTVYGGDRVTEIPPKGAVTTTAVTDIRGRTVELHRYSTPPTVNGSVVSGGQHDTTRYHFTDIGLAEKLTDPAGNTWTYGFDFLGRRTRQTDPDSGTTSTTYDLTGLVTSTTDARGQVLAFTYDELGRKTGEFEGSTAGRKLASWVWDGAQGGVGKLFYSTRHTPTGNWVSGVSLYNGLGLPSSLITQVPAGETGLAGNYTTLMGYTSTGQLSTFQPASGGGLPGEVIGITNDKFGKPVTTQGYNAYVSASKYTPYGENSQFTMGPSTSSAWLSYDYDAQTRRLTNVNLSAQKAFPQIDDTRYSHDAAGNITRSVNTQGQPDSAPVRTQCFTYDAFSRLSQAWTATDSCAAAPSNTQGSANVGGPTAYWTSWTFKPGGLRESETRHALPGATGGDTTTTYDYPTSGSAQPHALASTTTTGPGGTTISTFGYDASGNTTTREVPSGAQELKWDRNNRLESVKTPRGTTSYLYDADGAQLVRSDPGKVTLYLPGQELSRDTNTGTVTGTRYYSHNGVVVALRVGNTNPQYVVSDQHGTSTVVVDSVTFAVVRRVMDPYGNQIGAVENGPWPDSRGFLGKPVSADTGLTDIGARKYDSATGRFISVDPILDPSNPDQLCGYSYAENNPITRSDPSGMLTIIGVGEGGIAEALGTAHDIQVTAKRRYQQAHIFIQWGYVKVWVPWFIGPQIPIYIPAVLITIWFTWMPNCVPPKPKGPSVGPDPLTRAERAAYNKAHPPPRPTPAQKPMREQIRDLLVGLTGADKIVNCLREGAVGDCIMGFGPLVAGPLAKGVVSVATRGASRGGGSVAISNAAGHSTAKKVELGGRPDNQTVFAGHGVLRPGAGEVTVPEGTSIAMYVHEGERIKDSAGLAVELGTGGVPVEVFGPGMRVPNYTLGPSRGDLVLASGSYTVGRSTPLSELLIPDMGMTHWAACREFIC
ncbi:putative adhesin [Saccharothrix isguenensis]